MLSAASYNIIRIIFCAALPSVRRHVHSFPTRRPSDLPARDIIPPLGGVRSPPIAFDPAQLSSHCDFPSPPELDAVNPHAVHDHVQPTPQRHDRLFHPAMPGDLHRPGLAPVPLRLTHQHALSRLLQHHPHHLLCGLTIRTTPRPLFPYTSPFRSSREGHHSTVGWSSISSYRI